MQSAEPNAAEHAGPLRLRRRSDLIAERQAYRGRSCWVIKDPLALEYFRFEDEEYALLNMLDGQATLRDLQSQFEQQFAPQQITLAELQRFVTQLYHSSLVICDLPGQATQFAERRAARRRQRRRAGIGGLLCLRFPGIDPQRLLDRLHQACGWIFSPPAVTLCWLLILAAGLLVFAEWHELRRRLPTFHEFFGPGNWALLLLTLSGTKILHELGHGLVCRRFGGRCHEMGVMLLVLAPCLYCNVSDSWLLASKWRRAAIAAAGMYVELVLAASATFIWWYTEPGIIHYLSLNVMFVASISTLLFNANPLLRYDGYYILSDLLEIPNLRQKATAVLTRAMSRICLGLCEAPDPFLPRRGRWLLGLYAIAAVIYRLLITVSILSFLYYLLEPYGLKSVSVLLAAIVVVAMIVEPLRRMLSFIALPGRWSVVRRGRLIAVGAGVVAICLAVLLAPLPHDVRCVTYVQPRGAAAVYAQVPGTLSEVLVRPGEWVEEGQPLARLENVDVQLSVLELEARHRQLQARHQQLQYRALRDERAAAEVDEVARGVVAVEEQLTRRRLDQQRLVLRAPRSGFVLPAPPRRHAGSAEQLRGWSGRMLDPVNCGAFLSDHAPLCYVGDPHEFLALLAVDQGDMEFVSPGQTVEMFLPQRSGDVIHSRVHHVSHRPWRAVPASLSNKHGGQLPTTTTPQGWERPHATLYQASAEFDDQRAITLAGATGRARIRVGYRSLASQLWRLLQQTVRG